jgi:hypothetical protein
MTRRGWGRTGVGGEVFKYFVTNQTRWGGGGGCNYVRAFVRPG